MRNRRIKYKCKDCGHVFYGNESTKQCPNDYSYNIVPCGIFPWKKVLIAVSAFIAIVLLILLLIKGGNKILGGGNKIFDGGEKEYSITVSRDSVNVSVEVLCTNDSLDLKELRDSCQVVVVDSTETIIYGPTVFLKSNKLNVDISDFEPGGTYIFRLCKRKGGRVIGEASITLPLPPSKPVIEMDTPKPEMDSRDHCRFLGTYKVVINVTSGQADKFVLDGKEFDNNIITGVRPKQGNSHYVIVRAYDSQNDLWSDSVSYRLPPINTSSVSAPDKETIQRIFDRVARRDPQMMPGDAIDAISGGENVSVIEGNKKRELEDVLQVLFQDKKRKVIKRVNYTGTECSRVIKSIEI